MDREQAVARLETLVDRVERETMPVPVREVWAFGDVALGLDPVERLDVYLTKDVIMGGDSDAAANFAAEYGVKGVGTSVHAEWAEAHPDRVRTSDNGYAAPRSASRPNWSTTARRGAPLAVGRSPTTASRSTSKCVTRASRTTCASA